MGVDCCNLTGLKGSLGEIGETGQIAIAQYHFFLNCGVVGH
jgi:hypothetical protein